MKVERVDIEGFMAIGSAALGLADRGLVLIQGDNRDDASTNSNGSGKSTIPDAVSWCLYGVTARGESGDDIINTTRKTASVITHLIDDDGTAYVVSRYRKDKTHKNHVILEKLSASAPINLTLSSDKETQVRINQIMGCDVDVFNAAIYQGQECIPDMPNMTDKQIKNLIEKAAGIEVLEQCYKLALFKKNEAGKLVDKLATHVGFAMQNYDQAKSDLVEVREQASLWNDLNLEKIATAEELVVTALENKRVFDVKLSSADEKVPAIKVNIAKHESVLEEKNSCDEALQSLRNVVADCDTEVRLANATYERASHAHNGFTNKMSQVSARIGTDCGECGKEILVEDLKTVQTGIQMQIEKAATELESARVSWAGEEVTQKEAVTKSDEYKKAMPDYTETSERLNKCNLVLVKIETLRVEANSYTRAWEAAIASLKEIGGDENPHNTIIDKLKAKVKLADENVKDADKDRDRAVERCDLAQAVMEVYSPAGVRAHILDHVTPFLNARTAHYLSALSDGNIFAIWSTISHTKKGEMREKFSIEVSNMTGGKKFGLLSGGEKRKVRLSCAMALQDVVAGRATKPIELFMADEIDDALDDAGLERLMGLLEEKARERGTVLVISHRSLSDWIREVAMVTKEGGVATISGALNA